MNEDLIKAKHQTATYKRKPDTKTSYYFQEGAKLLPNRIGISREYEFSEAERTGRNLLHTVAGQLKAAFRKTESSPYKQFAPFTIHTNIWQVMEYSLFAGYGSIGNSNQSGRIQDTGDLIVFYCPSASWEEVEIHFFPGMLKELHAVLQYLHKNKRCYQ